MDHRHPRVEKTWIRAAVSNALAGVLVTAMVIVQQLAIRVSFGAPSTEINGRAT